MTATTSQAADMNNYSVICRGCLVEGVEMKNLYEWGLVEDFCIFSDIQLSRSDNMSELLCTECEEALISCKRFRMQCQRSDMLLRDTAKRSSEKEDQQSKKEIKISNNLEKHKLTINITTENMIDKIYLSCPFKCLCKFIKQKDLLIHLIKQHNLDANFIVDVKYHCPFSKCLYNSEKHFVGRKYLNQHLVKVHTPKTINCYNCKTKFATDTEYYRHINTCNVKFACENCKVEYKTHERLLVHLKRRHPDLHTAYKNSKRLKTTVKSSKANLDSPKISSATQTLMSPIKSDITMSWLKNGDYRNCSTIETQTVFEDLLPFKCQNSEEDSMFFSETVSLSDIQTQTFLEKISSETQTKDLVDSTTTQTCFCHDSPKSSPKLDILMAADTPTSDLAKLNIKTDVLLSSTTTQTCFDQRL